jgi:multidrug resistance efflux pump
MLAKTVIRAPQDATVLRRHRRAGELVSPETGALFTLADTSRLRVRVEVDETDVARLSLGQAVWMRADAYGDRRFTGRVSRVGLALGRKQIRTERPTEKNDTAVLETMVDLDPGMVLPIGLRVDVFIQSGR